MRRKHPGGGMHHRCTLAGLPASMAFRWRKSPCRPSLSQKNTASRGRMGQICGKSKKSEQVRAGAWGTGGNADNGSGGCGYIAWPGAGRTPRLPSPVAARRVGIAAPKPVCLPNGMRLLRRNSPGCQSQAPRNSFGGTDEGAGTQGARERPPAGLTRRKSRARRGSWG